MILDFLLQRGVKGVLVRREGPAAWTLDYDFLEIPLCEHKGR
jgi:hypothetical protein